MKDYVVNAHCSSPTLMKYAIRKRPNQEASNLLDRLKCIEIRFPDE